VPPTHLVTNQPPPLVGHDVLAADRALLEAVTRHGATDQLPALHELGRRAGSAEALRWGVEANEYPPRLRTHDRFGHRIDDVDFHPSWHRLLEVATAAGLHAAPWASASPAAHVARAAGFVVWSQVEAGHGCPISMTYAAVPALRTDPALAAAWEPLLAAPAYRPGLTLAAGKGSALAGMAMTEKQGGSDVRANTTTAAPAPGTYGDGAYVLTGHKWFCSAPTNDVFLVLAQPTGSVAGPTCFVVPRVLPDGTGNPWAIQRLKDKLGNRSNASSEIEMDGTVGWRLGDEGRGVATIVAMVAATRLDCVLGSAALLRRAVAEATWHAAHRSAFGRLLADQPLMQQVLADLALESEAATALGIRLAATFDSADPAEAALRRVSLPVAKYWVCKRTGPAIAEALECLGGNGAVEESGLPRLYREAPINAIWEGSGNIQALDLLRALSRDPECVAAWDAEVGAALGIHAEYDAAVKSARSDVEQAASPGSSGAGAVDPGAPVDPGDRAVRASRRTAARMAVLLQASLLLRYSPPAVADAFVASRVAGATGGLFGELPDGVDAAAILARATPTLAGG
jgi:putative acyl-CoA dehydrogenase